MKNRRKTPTRTRGRTKGAVVTVALSALLVTGIPALASASTADAAGRDYSFNPVTALTADTFATPPSNDLPWVRWNVPVTADPAVLQAQLDDMHDKRIGGVEIGQGGFPDNTQLEAILERANEHGIKVSLSHGPTKGIIDQGFDHENVRKSLFVGRSQVTSGANFSGALPMPAPDRGGERLTTLVAVQAYQCTDSTCAIDAPAELDPESVIDLTDQVTGTNTDGFSDGSTSGDLEWTAPEGTGTWQLVAFWSRGVFAQSDPLTDAGHDEVIAAMRTYFSPRVLELLRANGGDIFYDSHSSDRGAPREVWSNTFAADFEAQKGYDLVPSLAAAMRGTFTFDDGSDAKIYDDIVTARTSTWLEGHILPMQQFVRDEFNLVLRVQPEGENSFPIFDMAGVASVLDRPEHENLFASDEVDNYLSVASANHMTGNPWYSTECCALGGGNYLQTYGDVLPRMAKSYAGGITKLVYHTYPYSDTPESQWPGYANWGLSSFGTAWGPRDPMWEDSRDYNEFFARHDQILTQGDAKVDVAVYHENYLYPEAWSTEGGFRIWRDMGLQDAGYTRDYLSPELMKLPNATVTDGRLAVDGPAYKALILDSSLEPETDPIKTSISPDAIEGIVGYASAGLPVIVVGDAPDRAIGMDPDGDSRVLAAVDQLLALSNVHRVGSQAEVPALLEELGVRPAVDPGEQTSIVSQQRYDETTDTRYFFLYNEGRVGADDRPEKSIFEPESACATEGAFVCVGTGEAVDWTLALEGEGYPFKLDATTGEITPIAEYRVEKGRVIVPVSLARDESTFVALSTDPMRFDVAPAAAHVLASDADAGVAYSGDSVVARSTQPGSVESTLNDGTVITSEFGDIPAAIDLTGATWSISAEDWQPSNDYETTFGVQATETTKHEVAFELGGLAPWPAIPELENASGRAAYATKFDLPADWNAANGALLNLGEVLDSFTVTVNETPVLVNQTSATVDLGAHLRAGANTITVEVATNLNNRLAALAPAVAERGNILNYGLIGPVTVQPYETAIIAGEAGSTPPPTSTPVPTSTTPPAPTDSSPGTSDGEGGGAETDADGQDGDLATSGVDGTLTGFLALLGFALAGTGTALLIRKRRERVTNE